MDNKTVYADYAFFKGKYPKSEITAQEYDVLCLKAHKEIENAVSGTIEVTPDVQMCVCELVNYIYESEAAEAKTYGVSSERVGDYSVSYSGKSQQDADDKRKKRDIIKFWLGKSLTYRGVSRHVL